MTIYLDVVFIENLCMNSIILFATGLVTKVKCNPVKILLSSALGSLYVIGKYMTQSKVYSNFFIQIGLSIVMVYIAFSPSDIKKLFKHIIIFYLTSFVFGGCAFALLYYIKPQNILYNNGFLKGTYPIKIAFLGAMVGLVMLNIAFKIVKNRINKNDMFCNIIFQYKEKTVKIKAIIDSGNLLKEPITGASVIVVERKSLEGIIEKEILENLQEIISGTNETLNEEYISRFRLIPFSSLGKQNGMLLGFKPDCAQVEFDGEIKSIKKVVIGIYDKEITKNEEYSGLVGLDILEERSERHFEHNRNIKV